MFSGTFIDDVIDELESRIQSHISRNAELRIEVAKLVADKTDDKEAIMKLVDILSYQDCKYNE